MVPIVIPAAREHAIALARGMRAADAAECIALGVSPEKAAVESVIKAIYAWAWLVDGEPACIFGIGGRSLIGTVGHPWLLSTPALERHAMTFLRSHRPYLQKMLSLFPVLTNVVDARYVTCVRWLRWMGFDVLPAEPMGPSGVLFHRFEMRA